jgi:hypothetical protein
MKYVKKRIPIDAVQWFKEGDHHAVICNFFDTEDGYKEYAIRTREGDLAVTEGCWIVGPGAEGEYWPVQDSIFRATYEPFDSGE